MSSSKRQNLKIFLITMDEAGERYHRSPLTFIITVAYLATSPLRCSTLRIIALILCSYGFPQQLAAHSLHAFHRGFACLYHSSSTTAHYSCGGCTGRHNAGVGWATWCQAASWVRSRYHVDRGARPFLLWSYQVHRRGQPELDPTAREGRARGGLPPARSKECHAAPMAYALVEVLAPRHMARGVPHRTNGRRCNKTRSTSTISLPTCTTSASRSTPIIHHE